MYYTTCYGVIYFFIILFVHWLQQHVYMFFLPIKFILIFEIFLTFAYDRLFYYTIKKQINISAKHLLF